MEVYDLKTMKREESVSSPLSVALGNFDGVHAGHAELIKETVRYAKANGCVSAVWTFADGAGVLPNKPDVPCITSTAEKLKLLSELSVDIAVIEDFESVRSLSPDEFVNGHLKDKLNVYCAVCGYDFRFGAGGKGTAELLKALMAPRDCIVVPQVIIDGERVSSTAVRELILKGNMETCAKLLGHPFFIESEVVTGKQLGRTIGIPTANQYFDRGHIVPKSGIYACTVTVDGTDYTGVSNVGIRPTIENDDHLINCETHIIGYDGYLYGKKVKISFVKRLRDEIKFDNVEALRRQIELDIKTAEEYFSECR